MNKENQQAKSVDDILTEQEVLDLFGIERGALDRLRQKEKLPFCKVTHRKRIYLVKDLLNFLEKKRMVLNRGSD